MRSFYHVGVINVSPFLVDDGSLLKSQNTFDGESAWHGMRRQLDCESSRVPDDGCAQQDRPDRQDAAVLTRSSHTPSAMVPKQHSSEAER